MNCAKREIPDTGSIGIALIILSSLNTTVVNAWVGVLVFCLFFVQNKDMQSPEKGLSNAFHCCLHHMIYSLVFKHH